ncbi:unnamed protein product [Dracunculus medinensis]|uniref:DIX domain-containing protein n=1 Tax=Dracunculus medinensis TaxID=318479 RepID=A0A0N4UM16_DRAME|nr:unnamed protein product [Dracunculus medinensis]
MINSSDASVTADAIIDATTRLSLSSGSTERVENIIADKNERVPSASTPATSVCTTKIEISFGDRRWGKERKLCEMIISPTDSFIVYYHIDDETVPYCTDVQVHPDKITLGDFKRILTRSNFKYYCKAPAPDSVKVEIRDDNERLHRSANVAIQMDRQTYRLNVVPGPAPTLYPVGSLAYRQAVQQYDQSIASTDSESMISDLRGLPIQMKGVLNRRPFQQQYILPQGSIFFEFLILLKRFYESKWSAMFSPSVLELFLIHIHSKIASCVDVVVPLLVYFSETERFTIFGLDKHAALDLSTFKTLQRFV